MRGKIYVDELINEYSKTGTFFNEQLKGLSEEELQFLIDNTISGGENMKAVMYDSLKEHI